MWNQLKRTFVFAQIMILVFCAAAGYYSRGNWAAVASVFLTMQLGNLAGAWWAARLRRRIEDRSGAPLLRPR